MGKPERGVYEALFRLAGSGAGENVERGDNLEWDVGAPQSSGLRIWVTFDAAAAGGRGVGRTV